MSTATPTTIPRFVVMRAKACMPSSLKFGNYGKVAVVETDGETMPQQIHPNHNAVVRIVEVWDRRNIGKTDRSAFWQAVTDAEAMADELNTTYDNERLRR